MNCNTLKIFAATSCVFALSGCFGNNKKTEDKKASETQTLKTEKPAWKEGGKYPVNEGIPVEEPKAAEPKADAGKVNPPKAEGSTKPDREEDKKFQDQETFDFSKSQVTQVAGTAQASTVASTDSNKLPSSIAQVSARAFVGKNLEAALARNSRSNIPVRSAAELAAKFFSKPADSAFFVKFEINGSYRGDCRALLASPRGRSSQVTYALNDGEITRTSTHFLDENCEAPLYSVMTKGSFKTKETSMPSKTLLKIKFEENSSVLAAPEIASRQEWKNVGGEIGAEKFEVPTSLVKQRLIIEGTTLSTAAPTAADDKTYMIEEFQRIEDSAS